MSEPNDAVDALCEGIEEMRPGPDMDCPRCDLNDWAAFPTLQDFRCGGCGLWLVTWMLNSVGYDEIKAPKLDRITGQLAPCDTLPEGKR